METAATNAAETDALASDSEQVTESAPVETEGQAPEVEKPKDESEPEWFTKRIGEITARLRSTERENQEMKRQIEYREKAAKPDPADEKPKTLADFDFDEVKYQGYLFETAEKRAIAASDRRDGERVAQVNAERRARKFQEREIEFEKETPDYKSVAHFAPITDGLAEIIQDLDTGPELAYFLGKNQDVALTLGDLPIAMAAIELGRIDARLQAKKLVKNQALEKARLEKAVSKAPDPAPKLDGGNAAPKISSTDPDSYKLTDDEWVRAENARLKRKAAAAKRA